jgi:ArsR family transcriptional regulator
MTLREIMKQSNKWERVERLLESGLCKSDNPEKHIKKLKNLAELIDEEEAKKKSFQFKALADPIRVKILQLLKNRQMCSCEIIIALDISEPNASHHLNILVRNGWITSEKIGKWVFYKLNSSAQSVFSLKLL